MGNICNETEDGIEITYTPYKTKNGIEIPKIGPSDGRVAQDNDL